MADVFDTARETSRFWLPSLLHDLASLAAPMCGADGCEIFLIWRDRLYLAATTRHELRHRLFDEELSYTIDEEELRRAADYFNKTGEVNEFAGLSGWCAAFNRPLRLADVSEVIAPIEDDRSTSKA